MEDKLVPNGAAAVVEKGDVADRRMEVRAPTIEPNIFSKGVVYDQKGRRTEDESATNLLR